MINGKTFTGREIREKLQLQSADFRWSRKENNIIVETKGYGTIKVKNREALQRRLIVDLNQRK